MREHINFTLNGKNVVLDLDSDRRLLWVLRTDLGLTGTKYGCGENYCGACTVLVDNEAGKILPDKAEGYTKQIGSND